MIATGRRLRFDGGKWVAVPYFLFLLERLIQCPHEEI